MKGTLPVGQEEMTMQRPGERRHLGADLCDLVVEQRPVAWIRWPMLRRAPCLGFNALWLPS